MDSNNFVGQSGNGYTVYANGQNLGNFSNETQAEQAYNNAEGLSNGGATTGSGLSDVSLGADQLAYLAANDAATQAYNQQRLQLIDLPMLQVDKDKLALQAAAQAYDSAFKQAQLTGTYTPITGLSGASNPNGVNATYGVPVPTLASQQLYGYSGGSSGTGTPTLQNIQQSNTTALDALNLLSKLQSNPFQEEAVARGLGQTGIPNLILGMMQGGRVPGFQAPQANAIPPSLLGLAGQAMSAGGVGLGSPAPNSGAGASAAATQAASGTGTSGSGFTAPGGPGELAGVNVDKTLAGLPAPNKLNATQYATLAPDAKNFLMSAYQAAGYDPTDVEAQMKSELPGYTAPRYGTVQA